MLMIKIFSILGFSPVVKKNNKEKFKKFSLAACVFHQYMLMAMLLCCLCLKGHFPDDGGDIIKYVSISWCILWNASKNLDELWPKQVLQLYWSQWKTGDREITCLKSFIFLTLALWVCTNVSNNQPAYIWEFIMYH